MAAEDETIKEDGIGLGGHADAQDPEPVPLLLDLEADAQAEAARRLALMRVRRSVFHATAKAQPLQLDLGQTVQLTHPRFGLSAGRLVLVVGLSEAARVNVVDLDLWG